MLSNEQLTELCSEIPRVSVDSITECTRDLAAVGASHSSVSDMLLGVYKAEEVCHYLALKAGWHSNVETGELDELSIPTKIAMCHSELSEALEAARKDLNDDHLPHRKGIEVELADALIRIFDLAGRLKLDLAGAMADKLVYNTKRADHKLGNRAGAHGKKF